MQVVTHQLELAPDGSIDAHDVFTDIGCLRNGRNELAGTEIGFRKCAGVEFPNRILVDQVGWDCVVWERLALRQTIRRIEGQLCRVVCCRNKRGGAVRRHDVG